MKIDVLKHQRRFDSIKSINYGIQTFGMRNDYPQTILEILAASITGSLCVKRYYEFLFGRGFNDDLKDIICNKRNETFNDILLKTAKDYATFGGFAILVNYNANFRISSIYSVPFENVRLDLPNKNGNVEAYAIHDDWGKINTRIKQFSADDIIRVAAFNPNPEIIGNQVKVAGGFSKYTGQLFYYSNNGRNAYPLPIYDSAVTDMCTEEGISNITYRNARCNFLPSGMLIDICKKDQSEDEVNSTEESILQYQGDTNAVKMIYAQVESKDEIPQFVEFKTQNYDKEYTESRASVKDNIGRSFNQPPILRAENVNTGFSTTEMLSAYNYYNSVTTPDRFVLSRCFEEILKHWYVLFNEVDTEIKPLVYDVNLTKAEKMKDVLPQFLQIITDEKTTLIQKRAILRTMFDFTDDEINSILPI